LKPDGGQVRQALAALMPVFGSLELEALLAQHAPGDVVRLGVDRGGTSIELVLTLGRRP
jgi:S1-C subfamily serine protease